MDVRSHRADDQAAMSTNSALSCTTVAGICLTGRWATSGLFCLSKDP